MAEWSNALVLKTSVPQGTGGSSPSISALVKPLTKVRGFFYEFEIRMNFPFGINFVYSSTVSDEK